MVDIFQYQTTCKPKTKQKTKQNNKTKTHEYFAQFLECSVCNSVYYIDQNEIINVYSSSFC